MKSTEAGLKFPALGFTTDGDIWGFPDLDRLTKCGSRTLKENMQDGMELVDANGQRWRVLSIRKLQRTGSWLMALLTAGFSWRIEQELEALPAISLADVQERARKAMEHSRIDYYGEDGEAEYKATLRKIDKARSIARIYALLEPDTFEPY